MAAVAEDAFQEPPRRGDAGIRKMHSERGSVAPLDASRGEARSAVTHFFVRNKLKKTITSLSIAGTEM